MAPPTFWDAGMTDLHTVFLSASLSHNGKAQYFANQRIKQLGNDGLRGALMWYDPSVKEDPALPLDFYFPVTGIVTSRNSWEPNDYYFSFKAGLNARTHSHLEAGAFTFYSAGMWFIPTPGMGRGHQMAGYWQFEDKRADFFSPSAESVSTLIVNGKNQRFDVDAKGQITDYIASSNAVWIDSDLKDAYHDVDSIQRNVFHRRGEYLLILDDVSAPTPVKVEWLAQTLPPLTKVLGNKIMISNSESSLDLTSLDANLKFSPRAPTSKIVDIPQDEQATYALAQTGTSVQYSVLLEPRKVGATGPKIATEIDAKGKIHLRGNGWEDIISLARSKKSGDEPIDAKSSVIRMKDGKMASVVASFSTAAKLDAFEMQTATPVSWVWDGSELTFAKGFTGDFKVVDASKKLVDEKGTPIVLDKTVTLPAGRYFIRNRN